MHCKAGYRPAYDPRFPAVRKTRHWYVSDPLQNGINLTGSFLQSTEPLGQSIGNVGHSELVAEVRMS